MSEARAVRVVLTAEEKLEIAGEALVSLRAIEPVVLDMRELTVITDYFLIANGTSNVHIRALADRVIERLEERRLRVSGSEGYPESRWILLDYGDLVVHIFAEEERELYALERLWSDAPRTRLESPDDPSDG
jgi:ribosome-associated protein